MLFVRIVLAVFRRFRKISKSDSYLRLSVCPSVLMVQLGSHWTDCPKFDVGVLLEKPVEKTQVSLKSDKNNGYFTCRLIYIFDHTSFIFA